MMRHSRLTTLSIAAMLLLTGCGGTAQQVVTITQQPYEKLEYQTAEVKRGDISASMTLEVKPEGYEEIIYRVSKEELELEEVHCSIGDRVNAGDILVSFQSEQIQKKIADYEEEKEQKELLAQHYESLMKVDPDTDYQADIDMLRADIQVAQLYIEEAGRILAEYQIAAKEDGIITDISEYLQNGVIKSGVELLRQVSGTGRYIAEASDTEMFSIGEIYIVRAGETEFEFRLTDISDNTLIFQPVSGMALVSIDDKLTLTLDMPEQKNVVYVNRHAVCTIDGDGEEEDTYCVYLMEESGYQRAVFVTPGERIGDNLIITEGLTGGEKVVIR